MVEIDDEDWRGVEAGPSDRVELRGEIDREWQRTELEADSVQLLQMHRSSTRGSLKLVTLLLSFSVASREHVRERVGAHSRPDRW